MGSKRIEKFAIRRKADAKVAVQKRVEKAERRLMRDARITAGARLPDGRPGSQKLR